jgi:hypothetical protein
MNDCRSNPGVRRLALGAEMVEQHYGRRRVAALTGGFESHAPWAALRLQWP